MAEVLPQIRVRADTQSQEASSKVETPVLPPLRDATKTTGNGRISSPESAEGETPLRLSGSKQHGAANKTKDVSGAADTATPVRQLPSNRSYPSKFMQTLSGNQANAASKSSTPEERRDSQAIDPLSHVRSKVPGQSEEMVLRYGAVHPQQGEYPKLSASEGALRSRRRRWW